MREARSSGPFRQVAPSAWGSSDPWEFLIGLEGRASNKQGEAPSRTAPRLAIPRLYSPPIKPRERGRNILPAVTLASQSSGPFALVANWAFPTNTGFGKR